MGNWSLRFKLNFTFTFAAVLTIAVGLSGIANQKSLLDASHAIVQVEMPKLNHVSEMKRMVREALGLFLQLNLTGNDEKDLISKTRTAYNIVKAEITEKLDLAAKRDYPFHIEVGIFYRERFKAHRFALYEAYDNLYKVYKDRTDSMIAQSAT